MTTIITTIIIVIDDLHLMAERLGMGDSNWTCLHKVTVGRTHLVIVSISCGSSSSKMLSSLKGLLV